MAKRDETVKVEVQAITDAGVALSEDQAGRMKRYFASMMIRTACFILAVILPSPYRWFALVGAVTLPYIAVVVANAGRETIFGRAKRLDVVRDARIVGVRDAREDVVNVGSARPEARLTLFLALPPTFLLGPLGLLLFLGLRRVVR